MKVPFNNLKPLHALLADELEAAVQRVLASGWFILGPELEAFEQAFADYHGVAHAIGVANGTDAIELALRVADIGRGDEVITVAHTAVATVCAIEQTGARPVLVDIDPTTYTMNPAAAEAAITPRTKAIIPVHLYGQPADLDALTDIAARHNLLLIEDCAQAHGAKLNDKRVGTMGTMGAFSFYPTKNLGAYGDGGAIITNDSQLAERLRRLRTYGQSSRYIHAERGINSRLDEMQAAILAVKLAHLDEHNSERRELARLYNETLSGVTIPVERANAYHVYHLYVVRHRQRDELMLAMQKQGIGTLVHYPVPVHYQQAYADLGYPAGSLPETEKAAAEIVSLPLYVGLPPSDVETVARAVNEWTNVTEVGFEE
ncbi:MAG: DegT/DnrJ/EryC1/StrS family aminotransferase [Burkholderiales bacterium]|nr:DegT/DnrJ/EryC1/StrS family aminotransferase [Anaerolineae bacterium]